MKQYLLKAILLIPFTTLLAFGGDILASRQRGWVWDRSETSFTYNHYYFFQVQMDVKEHLPEN
jgi:hypothetical protein